MNPLPEDELEVVDTARPTLLAFAAGSQSLPWPPIVEGLSPAGGAGRRPLGPVRQPWMSQPSVARAASMTVSANAGWGWMMRATSG